MAGKHESSEQNDSEPAGRVALGRLYARSPEFSSKTGQAGRKGKALFGQLNESDFKLDDLILTIIEENVQNKEEEIMKANLQAEMEVSRALEELTRL